MRKAITSVLIIVLSLMLVLPAVAFAKGGPPAGKGPGATPPGQAKKAAAPAEVDAAEFVEGEEPADETTDDDPAPGKAEAKAAKKAEKEAARTERAAAKTERKGPGAAVAASADESASVETSGSAEAGTPAKLTGIANALSRILANIERAEARVAEGKQSAVPAGLLSVLAKFMGWLGIEAEPDPVADGPAIDEPTEGSEEETGTLLLETGSEEDTETATPEVVE